MVVEGILHVIPFLLAVTKDGQVKDACPIPIEGNHQVRPVKEGYLALVIGDAPDDHPIPRVIFQFFGGQVVMAVQIITSGHFG